MASKPSVLMFIDWYLPGFRAGGPIRSCANMVAHLSQDVDFYILTSDRDYLSDTPYPSVSPSIWSEGQYGEQIRYEVANHLDKEMMRVILKEVDPDLVYIHGIFSPKFSIASLRVSHSMGFSTILAPRGMLRKSAFELKKTKKLAYVKLAKLSGLFKGLTFHATDKQEVQDIKARISSKCEVHLAPNLPRPMPATFRSLEKQGSLKLVFAGRVAPEKNLAFALEALNQLRGLRIHLDIYGAIYDEEYWARCHDLIGRLPEGIEAEHHEPVGGNQILDILRSSHALFLPTRGENFGHIILESFMAARPVIISDQTPWTKLEQRGAGWDLSLDTPSSFADALRNLASMTQSDYDSHCQAAFDLAESYTSDSAILAASKALFLPS